MSGALFSASGDMKMASVRASKSYKKIYKELASIVRQRHPTSFDLGPERAGPSPKRQVGHDYMYQTQREPDLELKKLL